MMVAIHRFDDDDKRIVREALEAQELWPYGGANNIWRDTRGRLEAYFARDDTQPLYAVPAGSGTAAIHVALGGLQSPAGSEVIVPPITDMGTVMPVIFQNAIPVFADVDSQTGLVTAETIEDKMTERTSAVVVVHLAGSPADMDPILALCARRGVKVIEDAAQALGATYKGRLAGTMGDAGCFSLNAQKHITCGEGGFVLVKDENTYLRCLNFSDKHRNRTRDPRPEHKAYAGVGINYRLADLELALIQTQLPKLKKVAAGYTAVGRQLDARMEAIDGLVPQHHHADAVPTYFMQMFRFEGKALERRPQIETAIKAVAEPLGIQLWGPYNSVPIYAEQVFRTHNFFDTIGQPDNAQPVWPAELVARHHYKDLPPDAYDYNKVRCRNAEDWCENSAGLRFHDGHTPDHADRIADAIEAALR